jgi:hypothetical protein
MLTPAHVNAEAAQILARMQLPSSTWLVWAKDKPPTAWLQTGSSALALEGSFRPPITPQVKLIQVEVG